jgi:hypothetical protein
LVLIVNFSTRDKKYRFACAEFGLKPLAAREQNASSLGKNWGEFRANR